MKTAGDIPDYHSEPLADAVDSDINERPRKPPSPLLVEESIGEQKTTEPEEVKVVLTGMLTHLQPCTD